MSVSEILEQLSTLTLEERDLIAQRVWELDDSPLLPEDKTLIEKRMAEHRANPESAVPLDEIIDRVQARLRK